MAANAYSQVIQSAHEHTFNMDFNLAAQQNSPSASQHICIFMYHSQTGSAYGTQDVACCWQGSRGLSITVYVGYYCSECPIFDWEVSVYEYARRNLGRGVNGGDVSLSLTDNRDTYSPQLKLMSFSLGSGISQANWIRVQKKVTSFQAADSGAVCQALQRYRRAAGSSLLFILNSAGSMLAYSAQTCSPSAMSRFINDHHW